MIAGQTCSEHLWRNPFKCIHRSLVLAVWGPFPSRATNRRLREVITHAFPFLYTPPPLTPQHGQSYLDRISWLQVWWQSRSCCLAKSHGLCWKDRVLKLSRCVSDLCLRVICCGINTCICNNSISATAAMKCSSDLDISTTCERLKERPD